MGYQDSYFQPACFQMLLNVPLGSSVLGWLRVPVHDYWHMIIGSSTGGCRTTTDGAAEGVGA